MNRCALALALAFAVALPAQAQRTFERNVLRGEMEVVAPPQLQIEGKPARLAPGARIRNPLNMIVLSGTLLGQRNLVHYRLDNDGQVRDVWLLTEAEARREPWPRTAEQAQAWTFDAAAQRWSKP